MKKTLFLPAIAGALALALSPVPAAAAGAAAQPAAAVAGTPSDEAFGENTVYYAGDQSFHKTLVEALKHAYVNPVADGTAEIYCKPGADVGAMTHGHVADDMVIHGNDAYVSAGERDLEIDTYAYDRTTGAKVSEQQSDLAKDVTVTVKSLDGIAAWGERHTAHAINLVFEDCQDMQRIYFTNRPNKDGKTSVSLDGCSFDGTNDGKLQANPGTAVYSNSDGDIKIKNTAFTEIGVALNINHKAAGTQTISLENCTFTDCAAADGSTAKDTKTYGAAVRVVSAKGATTKLSVTDCAFAYSEGRENIGNGDILIGDGRSDAAAEQGVVTLAMTGTDADVMVQKPGYYAADGTVADEAQGTLTEVPADAVVTPDEGEHFEIDAHDVTEIVNAKDATCTSEGYSGDKVCATCGKLVEKGAATPKAAHAYKDGVCTACGVKDPDFVAPQQPADKEPAGDKKPAGVLPQTGDAGMLAALAAMAGTALCGAGALRKRTR